MKKQKTTQKKEQKQIKKTIKIIKKPNTKSQAKRIHTLINRYEKILRPAEYKLTDFKEPVLFLMRRNGITDLYENATAGRFEFEHTDGTTKYIVLTPSSLFRHRYADRDFRAYTCHEDFPFPFPIMENPVLTAQTYETEMTRALRDRDDIELDKLDYKLAIANNWKWIIPLGIGSIVLGIIILKYFSPGTSGGEVITSALNTTKDTVASVLDAGQSAIGGTLESAGNTLKGLILLPTLNLKKIWKKIKRK